MTCLSVRSGNDQNINTVNLSLLKGSDFVLPPEIWWGVHQDPLFTVRNVLFVLTTQHSLDGGTVEILDDLVDNLCNIPVLGSDLDCSQGDLSGIVSGLNDICRDTLDFGGEDDSLGVGDCVTIELDTEHDLDDIAILEDDLGVRG